MTEVSDLRGQRFGALTVVSPGDSRHDPRRSWLCRCDCGRYLRAAQTDLTEGSMQSCGCQEEDEPEPLRPCPYNEGVECAVFLCSRCGWNPSEARRRQRRQMKTQR